MKSHIDWKRIIEILTTENWSIYDGSILEGYEEEDFYKPSKVAIWENGLVQINIELFYEEPYFILLIMDLIQERDIQLKIYYRESTLIELIESIIEEREKVNFNTFASFLNEIFDKVYEAFLIDEKGDELRIEK